MSLPMKVMITLRIVAVLLLDLNMRMLIFMEYVFTTPD